MTVGERIKELRTQLGLSQVEFAEKINVSKQTLYKYENNIITNIPSDKIEAAAAKSGMFPLLI
ncbi:MAG: helix-turn-helix domain-containing protein [Roseburia sp.]